MIKASDSRFRNFAEGLCESYQSSMFAERAKLVKAVEDARVSWDYSNRDAYAAHWKDYHDAVAALKAYDSRFRNFAEGLCESWQAKESAAKAIYETWNNQPGYVQWQDGGNSHMQDKAREMTSKENT